MSLIKKNECNTFEWKINHDSDEGYFHSDTFIINGHQFWLYAIRRFYSCSTVDAIYLWQFSLLTIDQEFLPSSYTFSICDREGHDYITVKGKIMMKCNKSLLMTLDYDGLNKGDIHRDSLTVRFTGNFELGAREMPRATEDEESVNLLETFSKDFSTFYESKTYTDCVLRVGDAQFHVHRAVLSARSRVFSAMFHHDTSESCSIEVNILNVKATVLSDILYYIYSGSIRGLTVNTASSMYAAADKYELLELKTKCLEFLKRNLTMDNFYDAALLFDTLEDMDLEERVVWFIKEKLSDILESDTWQQFIKDRTFLANKLLTSALMISKKK